jgi:hypothetical protein
VDDYLVATGLSAMITCERCQTEFTAHGVQGYPGGTDPPASHITYALVFGIAGVTCLTVALFAFRTVMLALGIAGIVGALFSLSAIPEAREICDRAGGGVCPSCGHRNEVKWYS